MWKKQDDAAAAAKPLEFGSRQMPELSSESAAEKLLEVYLNSQSDKGKSTGGPQMVPTEAHPQPSMSATMAAYREAVNEFTKNATAFIEQLPLLTKARESYEQAMKASASLRNFLDTGDEDLRVLMTQLTKVLDSQAVKPVPEKKKPELAKIEATSGSDESRNAIS